MASGATLLWLLDATYASSDSLAACTGWLGESERARMARFARPERRQQFVLGRALLRLALGRLLGMAPGSVVLHERPGAAPLLDIPDPSRAGFSISHSGPWIACAASTVAPVGLDIERIDARRNVLALAEHAFSEADAERLRAVHADERVDAFYRMWCLHESHIKLGGMDCHDYPFALPGLAGALSCTRALDPVPQPLLVHLDGLRAAL